MNGEPLLNKPKMVDLLLADIQPVLERVTKTSILLKLPLTEPLNGQKLLVEQVTKKPTLFSKPVTEDLYLEVLQIVLEQAITMRILSRQPLTDLWNGIKRMEEQSMIKALLPGKPLMEVSSSWVLPIVSETLRFI